MATPTRGRNLGRIPRSINGRTTEDEDGDSRMSVEEIKSMIGKIEHAMKLIEEVRLNFPYEAPICTVLSGERLNLKKARWLLGGEGW